MNELQLITGSYTLERLPKTTKGDLRAWDAADELLVNTLFSDDYKHLLEKRLNKIENPILIINDSFGALACALHKYPRHSWGDSYLAHLATLENFKNNAIEGGNYQAIPSTEKPSNNNLNQIYDLVILKIPKTLGLLEDQLSHLKPHINADTTIIASAMSKHIHTSTLKTFEKYIGTTNTSRATKKARLIFAKNDNENISTPPYPKTITDDELNLTLINHANVFAKDKLDIGSRFMIEQLKHCPSAKHIVDLGCGNGALGIMAQRLQPEAHFSFIDESYAAVKSAKENFEVEDKDKKSKADFYTSDCFKQFIGEDAQGVDLVLCNPPFHQNHSIGDHIAWQMLKQSHEQLEAGGEMWLIGNRHLGYHVKLKNLFGNCKTVATNKKFVILSATKS
jgi:16S rRNA G1207 methylase RsmC